MSSFPSRTNDEELTHDNHDNNNTLSSSSTSHRNGVIQVGKTDTEIANTSPSINVHVHPDPQSTTKHHVPVNESWRLCMEHKWISLQMRLSMFPDEARQVQLATKRSLLHEVVSVAAMEALALNNDDQKISQHDIHQKNNNADFVTPLLLRSVYFSCPQAMLLLDSIKGYTPLHCALVIEGSASKADEGEPKEDDDSPNHQDSNGTSVTPSSPSFDLVRSLLDLSLGRCVEDNDDNDDDNNSLFSEEEDEEETKEDEDDIIGNEEAVLLMRDALADTPLHTACRHGCHKRILSDLMAACPSALFHYNIARMTPLRLLWHNLEERLSNKQSNISVTNEGEDEGVAATTVRSDSPFSDGNSKLSDILVNEIKSYKDLTNHPAIHDTWEKSIMLLHIYGLSKSDHTVIDDDVIPAGATDEVLNMADFELTQCMTPCQIRSVMDESMISTLMPQDTYSDFLKRSPSIIMNDYPISTNANGSSENVVQQLDELKMLGTTDASGQQQQQLQNHHKVHNTAPVAGKRKRYFLFHDNKNHHSPQNANSTDNKNTPKVDVVKGIHPDENGMIPMPSYNAHNSNHAVDEDQYNSAHGTSFRHYVDEPNLFFDLDH